ncbi:hypothetical protein CYMTET_7805 [Cymbomonas tetramitiformis]|uniref:Uncharacterized protein n=1 Tax=Cymbomonas tetramitiformis TaxID=36881 RepID=A0AAE0GUS2_9CHLO|nr:hypothetical protein CYMTET_7805 [Cymbomonas tetramitiformis]
MRRSGAARKSRDKRKDFKKKEPSVPTGDDANKKPPREAAGPADGGKGAEAQARSEDGDDEAEYDSNFNEREEYAVGERVGPASEIAAILLAQRAIDLPKDIDNLLALEEIEGKEPTEPVRHPTDVNEHQCEDTPGTVAQEMENGAATSNMSWTVRRQRATTGRDA